MVAWDEVDGAGGAEVRLTEERSAYLEMYEVDCALRAAGREIEGREMSVDGWRFKVSPVAKVAGPNRVKLAIKVSLG